jgi:hypothetical protein
MKLFGFTSWNIGGALTALLLVPVPALALSLTWTTGPTSTSSLVGVVVDPNDPTNATVSFSPVSTGNSTAANGTFTISGTARVTPPGSGNINVVFQNWNAFNITGGSISFQATYNNQVLFNPAPSYNSGMQPPSQFAGIGQGANNLAVNATFTITFSGATWTTQKVPSPTLIFTFAPAPQ